MALSVIIKSIISLYQDQMVGVSVSGASWAFWASLKELQFREEVHTNFIFQINRSIIQVNPRYQTVKGFYTASH